MNYNLNLNDIRFSKYKGIEYLVLIDDDTLAPILIIKFPDDEIIEHKVGRTDIERLSMVSNLKDWDKYIIDKYSNIISSKLRKLKLLKINER